MNCHFCVKWKSKNRVSSIFASNLQSGFALVDLRKLLNMRLGFIAKRAFLLSSLFTFALSVLTGTNASAQDGASSV